MQVKIHHKCVLLSFLILSFKSSNPQLGQELLQPQLRKTVWKVFGSCWHSSDCFHFIKHKSLSISIATSKMAVRTFSSISREHWSLVLFFTSHFGCSEPRDLFSQRVCQTKGSGRKSREGKREVQRKGVGRMMET